MKLGTDVLRELLRIGANQIGNTDEADRRMRQGLPRAYGADAATADDSDAEWFAFDDGLPGSGGAPLRARRDFTGAGTARPFRN